MNPTSGDVFAALARAQIWSSRSQWEDGLRGHSERRRVADVLLELLDAAGLSLFTFPALSSGLHLCCFPSTVAQGGVEARPRGAGTVTPWALSQFVTGVFRRQCHGSPSGRQPLRRCAVARHEQPGTGGRYLLTVRGPHRQEQA